MNTGEQNLSEFFHNCNQAMEEFQKLHMDTTKQLGDLQLTFINLCMECQRDQMERLTKAETPSDMVAAESSVTTEYMDKFASNARQTFDTLQKLQDEMFNWMQDNPIMGQFKNSVENKTKKSKQPGSAKK